MSEKRYFWLKLPETFFRQKEIRGLRRKQDGAELVIIYQEIMLESIAREGRILFEGYAPTLAEELADTIGEDPEKVQTVLTFLEEHQLIEKITEEEIELPGVVSLIGSETAAAARMRKSRALRAEEPAESNTESTKAKQERNQSEQGYTDTENCHREIEIEKEIEIEQEIEKDTLTSPEETDSASGSKAEPVPYSQIMAAYNEILGDILPNVQKIDGNRRKFTKARYKEAGSVDELRRVFELVRESDFLSGRSGAWQANFDWIIKPANFQKIREGNYQNRERSSGSPAGGGRSGRVDTLGVLEKIYQEDEQLEGMETDPVPAAEVALAAPVGFLGI